jgi:hypothetical protein
MWARMTNSNKYGIKKFVNFLSLKEWCPVLNNYDWYIIWIRRRFLLHESSLRGSRSDAESLAYLEVGNQTSSGNDGGNLFIRFVNMIGCTTLRFALTSLNTANWTPAYKQRFSFVKRLESNSLREEASTVGTATAIRLCDSLLSTEKGKSTDGKKFSYFNMNWTPASK